LRRLAESQPRSLRLAVFAGQDVRPNVDLEPDYFGVPNRSNLEWVGYGLSDAAGKRRNDVIFLLEARNRQGASRGFGVS